MSKQVFRQWVYGDKDKVRRNHPQLVSRFISDTPECAICGEPVSEQEFRVDYTYWGGFYRCVHKSCQADVYDCQVIDADCNDCKWFQRGELLSKGIFSGWCKKFDKQVKAYPNFCSGHKCFEHRRENEKGKS